MSKAIADYSTEEWAPSLLAWIQQAARSNAPSSESIALKSLTPLVAPDVQPHVDIDWLKANAPRGKPHTLSPQRTADILASIGQTDKQWLLVFPPRSKADLQIRRLRMGDALTLYPRAFLELWLPRLQNLDYITVMNLMVANQPWGDALLEYFFSLDAFADLNDYIDVAKWTTLRIKTNHVAPELRAMLSEAQGLVGYRNLPFPGFDRPKDAERWAHGGKPHGLDARNWLSLFKRHADTIIQSAAPDQVPFMTLRQWVESAKWVTAGSSSIGRVEWKFGSEEGHFKVRKNYILDFFTIDEIMDFIKQDKGKQVNRTILKNELGKIRLVVAGDLSTYLVDSWLDYLCGHVYEKWPGSTLQETIEKQAQRMSDMMKQLKGRFGLPFDYAEFDHQATTPEIKVLTEKYFLTGEINVPFSALEEWRSTVEEQVEAYDEAVLIDRGTDYVTNYKITGGQLSGLRLTSVMGNLWNMVMTSIVKELMENLLLDPRDMQTYVRGDDSAIITDNYWTALLFRLGYQAINAIGNNEKFAILSEELEFLRVWYTPTRLYGLFNRVVPNITQRKPWSDDPWTPEDAIRAQFVSIATAARRIDRPLPLYTSMVVRAWTKQRHLSDRWLQLPKQLGGLGLLPWRGWEANIPYPHIDVPSSVQFPNLPKNTFQHYQTLIPDLPATPAELKVLQDQQIHQRVGADDIRGMAHILRKAFSEKISTLKAVWHKATIPNILSYLDEAELYLLLRATNLQQIPNLQAPADALFGAHKEARHFWRQLQILGRVRRISSFKQFEMRYPKAAAACRSLERRGLHRANALEYIFGELPALPPLPTHPLLTTLYTYPFTSLFSRLKATHQLTRSTYISLVTKTMSDLGKALAASPLSQAVFWW